MKPPAKFLIALAALLLASPYFFRLQADPDLAVHVKLGMDYLKRGFLLKTDPYSYVTSGEIWFNHEWLTQVLYGAIYQTWSDTGLFFLRSFLFLIFLSLLFALYLSRNTPPLAILTLYAVTLPYLSRFFNLRAHSFSYLLLPVFLVLLEAYRKGNRRLIYLLPFLMILWANLHGGFILGLAAATLGLSRPWRAPRPPAAGSLGEPRRDSCLPARLAEATAKRARLAEATAKRAGQAGREDARLCEAGASLRRSRGSVLRQDLWRMADNNALIVLGLTYLATLVNPYGIQIYAYLWKELGSSHGEIVEWKPFLDQPAWQLPLFLYLVFTAIPLAGWFLSKNRARQPEFILFLLFAAETLIHRRFFMPLVLLGSLVFADSLSKRQGSTQPFKALRWILIASLAILIPRSVISAVGEFRTSGFRVRPDEVHYSVKAMEFLKKNHLGTKLLVPFHWGNYAIWYLSPPYQVSADGRNLTVYPSSYIPRYLEAYREGNLKGLFGNLPPDAALVENRGAVYNRFRQEGRWKEIYHDEEAAIFVPIL